MAAPTRVTRDILASQTLTAAASGSEAAPGIVGAWVDVSDLNGGLLEIFVTNIGTPGVAGQFIVQASDVNTGDKIAELWRGAGNTAANASPPIPVIELPNVFKFVRLVAFGNTTASVTYRCVLFGKG